MTHLILFDAPCPLCNQAVYNLIKHDKKRLFRFASLQSKTARSLSLLVNISDLDSIILIEHYDTLKQRVFTKSKAIFRIFWLLGGVYKLIGWKYILPSWSIDWAYNLIAKNRYKICKVQPHHKRDTTRFLP